MTKLKSWFVTAVAFAMLSVYPSIVKCQDRIEVISSVKDSMGDEVKLIKVNGTVFVSIESSRRSDGVSPPFLLSRAESKKAAKNVREAYSRRKERGYIHYTFEDDGKVLGISVHSGDVVMLMLSDGKSQAFFIENNNCEKVAKMLESIYPKRILK